MGENCRDKKEFYDRIGLELVGVKDGKAEY